MAAVIVTSTHPLPTRRPTVERPALQVLDGGRRAARAYARAHPRSRPVARASTGAGASAWCSPR